MATPALKGVDVLKLTLTNETQYRTDDLRRFLLAGFRAIGASSHRDGTGRVRYKAVTVVYQRQHWARAWGAYGGHRVASYIKLCLPRDPANLNLGQLARTLRHECAHNLGLRHREMDAALRYSTGPDPAWIAGLAIRVATAPPAPTAQVRAWRREAHARRKLVRAGRRLASAQATVSRWTQRVAYYDSPRRRLAAAGKAGSPGCPRTHDQAAQPVLTPGGAQ